MLEHRSKSLENSINFTERRIIPIGKKVFIQDRRNL